MMSYWQNFSGPWTNTPFGGGWFMGAGWFVLFVLFAWSIVWKGLALWKAAHKGSKPWFVVLLIVNTVGILDILYLYVFSKKQESVEAPKK